MHHSAPILCPARYRLARTGWMYAGRSSLVTTPPTASSNYRTTGFIAAELFDEPNQQPSISSLSLSKGLKGRAVFLPASQQAGLAPLNSPWRCLLRHQFQHDASFGRRGDSLAGLAGADISIFSLVLLFGGASMSLGLPVPILRSAWWRTAELRAGAGLPGLHQRARNFRFKPRMVHGLETTSPNRLSEAA